MPRKSIETRARSGDVDAQFELADAFRAKEDWANARLWYEAAAKQGNQHAQNNLGTLYKRGLGVTADAHEAARWYRLAADQGNDAAQYNLGKCYLHGEGVALDPAQAAAWFQKAVRQGHVEALAEFGTMLRFGHGIEKDIVAAADFHAIAALEGNAVAIGNLADYHADVEAAGWQGNQTACLALAKMYDNGLGVEKNQARALAWLRWGRKHAVPQAGCDTELSEFHSFLELAAIADDAVALEAKKTYDEWVKRYKPPNRRKRTSKA